MEQLEKSIIEATGGIHIGKTFLKSFQASWPFGKIEIYSEYVILKIQYIPDFFLNAFQKASKVPGIMGTYKKIPKEIKLSYDDIEGYNEKKVGIMGYGITLIHKNKEYAPFLQVWISKNKATNVISYLNGKGITMK